MLRFRLLMCFALAQGPAAAAAESALTPEIRSELTSATSELGEIMRQDVEQITVDTHDIVEVPIVNTTPDGTVLQSDAAIVPFLIEGVGGGNTEQEFIALFVLMKPDEHLLDDFGHASNPHKHVGLLAFAQLDNRGPLLPS